VPQETFSPETIAREFGPLVSSLAFQFFGSHDEARDAAQEAWTEILQSLDSFRGDSSLKTWVYSVAWRRMLRLKRQGRLHSLRTLRRDYHENEPVGPEDFGPEARFWAEETCRHCMTGVLFCLTPEQRLAFLFRYTAELPYEEIAEILETSHDNARQLYSRARALLAQFMSSDCSYTAPNKTCAYGVHRWAGPSGLEAAFARMGSFGNAVEAFRIHPRLMPGPNYWEKFLKP